jgi:uncharacterized membrane protein YebE (DUF533 family)
MNSDEVLNLVKQLLTLGSGIAIGARLLTAEQAASLINDIFVIIPAVMGAVSVVWSVYSHWQMKKVPVAATAIITPEKVPLPVGEHLAIPGVGIAKVVA